MRLSTFANILHVIRRYIMLSAHRIKVYSLIKNDSKIAHSSLRRVSAEIQSVLEVEPVVAVKADPDRARYKQDSKAPALESYILSVLQEPLDRVLY
jgi:hypothetical protein